MCIRLGQIVTKIGNWKKLFLMKLFYPQICEGNIFLLLHKWLENLHGFANICKLPVAQTFKVMESKICKKVVFHKYFKFCFYKVAKKLFLMFH